MTFESTKENFKKNLGSKFNDSKIAQNSRAKKRQCFQNKEV